MAVLLVALATILASSYRMSHACIQRIACVHNQHSMRDALLSYEVENAGTIPSNVTGLRRYYRDPPEGFDRCPASPEDMYVYHADSGIATCRNRAHAVGP